MKKTLEHTLHTPPLGKKNTFYFISFLKGEFMKETTMKRLRALFVSGAISRPVLGALVALVQAGRVAEVLAEIENAK
jgi:hypothetical protein